MAIQNTPTEMRSRCPLCASGKMELVYNRPNQMIWCCSDCECTMNVPAAAWVSGVEKARTLESTPGSAERKAPASAVVASGPALKAGAPLPRCPLCLGRMELVYHRHDKTVCVCADCHTSINFSAVERGEDMKTAGAVSAP